MTINFPERLRKSLNELCIHLIVVLLAFDLVFLSINEVSHLCFQCSKHRW